MRFLGLCGGRVEPFSELFLWRPVVASTTGDREVGTCDPASVARFFWCGLAVSVVAAAIAAVGLLAGATFLFRPR